ncbi:MAG: sialidase family protein [Segetibacter sp.]
MRGPQITSTANGLIITANTTYGNIFAYHKEGSSKWSKATKVNDADSVSKEALMALSADGLNAFAVWLDTRGNNGKGQRLYGAQSKDGGKTWSKNILVYSSPDKTTCECCKPSVVVKGNTIHAMFRNWLNGNRDLYLISSSNGGKTFGQAQKLGVGSWKLNGCPMDGGGLAVDKKGTPETVWRREGKIFKSS